MTTLSRTAILPFDHLEAELIAFPLSSEIGLELAVTRLDPGMRGRTGQLWRAAEREMVASAPGMTLDELTALRDWCWFADLDDTDDAAGIPLHRHLSRVTRRRLALLSGEHCSGELPSDVGPQLPLAVHAQARRTWMWLTFALPSDLLQAVSGEGGWLPEPDLITAPVRDLLERGFAETHLHAGASVDFPTIWSALMARLASPGLADDALAAPGAVLGEGRWFTHALLHAAIGRTLLAHFLDPDFPNQPSDGSTFLDFLHGPFRDEFVPHAGPANFTLLSLAVRGLREGLLPRLDLAQLRGAYVELAGRTVAGRHQDLAGLIRIDPVAEILPDGPGTAEQRLTMRLTEHVDRRAAAGEADDEAETVFWQSARVRVMLYRHVTQRPLTPGLPWFIRFYDRMRKTRGPVSPRAIVEAAWTTSGIQNGLTSLEVRTSPDSAAAEMGEWTSVVRAQATDGPSDTEIGLVYHFLKSRGGDLAPGVTGVRGAGTHADPGSADNGGRCRFSRFYHEQMKGAGTLANLLYRLPATQYLVRGVDVCADELAVPTWVFHPLLDHVRRAAKAGARQLQPQLRRENPPPPLRTTVHAGEDFAHLLTGLRHVHEAIDVLELREGDRIGHGMALGIDPAAWARRTGRVAMPLHDRVLDMAWEWSWWTQRGGGVDAGRLAFLADSTAKLARGWLCDPDLGVDDPLYRIDVQEVQRLRSALADLDLLAQTGFPGPGPVTDPLLQRYLRDPAAFRRGMRTVTVNPIAEVDAIARIGASLRAEVSQRAIAIELNPTSNLLVGDLSDLANHPLWRLAPPRPNSDLPPLSVTVGSDDPVVFNCRLPMEYQLLYDTLIVGGLTDLEAMEWLDRVRRTGLERRFTVRTEKDELEALLAVQLSGDPPPPRIVSQG